MHPWSRYYNPMTALRWMKLTSICSKSKETTDESGSGVAGECDGGLSYDGHVGIMDTMTTCN